MKPSRTALHAVLFVGLLSAAVAVGCGQTNLHGQPILSNVDQVTLAQVLKDPATFKDKEVVLQGNYGGHCCPTDFNYKEGTNAVECYYPGFDVPHSKPGRPVQIHAVVRMRDRHEEHAAEGKAETGPEVYLDAKGVRFQ